MAAPPHTRDEPGLCSAFQKSYAHGSDIVVGRNGHLYELRAIEEYFPGDTRDLAFRIVDLSFSR